MGRLTLRLGRELDDMYAYLRPHLNWLSLMCVVAIPLFYLVEAQIFLYFDTLAIRLVVAALALPTVFKWVTDPNPRILKSWTYLFVVLLAPTGWGLILLLNAAHAPADEQVHILLIVEYLAVSFVFTNVVRKEGLVIVGWIISIIVFAITFALLTSINWVEVLRVIPFMLASIIFAFLVNRVNAATVAIRERDGIENAIASVANFSDELKGNLNLIDETINRLGENLENLDPLLTKHFSGRSQRRLELVRSTASDLKREVANCDAIVESLLHKAATQESAENLVDEIEVAKLVSEVVDFYPYADPTEYESIKKQLDSDFVARIDPILLRCVLNNLIKNALYFLKQGDQAHKVKRIYISTQTEQRTLVVRDNGAGIPAENLTRIFDPYITTSTPGKGSGVGLSFCKTIMNSIGGTIHCDSIEGEFTEFICTFPAPDQGLD